MACSLDNSEYTRNGDFHPTRLDAQGDAAQALFSAKRKGNVENSVGLMTMAGECPKTILSLSTDQRKMLAGLSEVKPSGRAHFLASLKVAQIILSHRQNSNQRQRIIAFVASPIDCKQEDAASVARQLRKNGVAVDIVYMAGADSASNQPLLEAFIDAVEAGQDADPDGERASRMVQVPINTSVIEALSMITGSDHSAAGAQQGDLMDFDDAEMDPELALALKMSLEEEMARQAKADTHKAVEAEREEEDPELAKAIAMSLEKN